MNNNSWVTSSKELSENNLSNSTKSIINLSDSNNTSDSNSNYGENIIQVIKGPYSLNNEIITNLDGDNLFISDFEKNIIPDYKIKRRDLKTRIDKSLPTILEDYLKE
uniref:Uncharacterized protein n=1 Tax=Clavaria fumosa TaxID=264083 RepID=A0A7T3PCU7_9AGAR|nr:hypothetical protein KQ422_mgp106 [Clavaria fumosa]QPZ51094.1 hypothetical protein [Clavaria fumosa]